MIVSEFPAMIPYRGRTRWIVCVSVLLAFTGGLRISSASAQPPAPLPLVQTLGPQVGERVPDFTLKDQHGQPRTLASLVGRNGLMLVFYRSADW